MAKARRSKTLANGRSPEREEHFTKMIRSTMEEPAWSALSTTAQALYPWLRLEWRGDKASNNGKLRLSVRQAADRIGVSINTAAEAFRDLQRKGFIVVREPACLGLDGAAKSPAYELTELALPGTEGHGRKLYKLWRHGSDFPVVRAMANNPSGRNGKKACHQNKDDTVINFETQTRKPSQK